MYLAGTEIWIDNGQPSEKIVVFAHNYVRFIRWCRRNGINYKSPMMKFVWNTQQLLGYTNMNYVDLGIDQRVTGNEDFYRVLATRGMHRIEPERY